jgi:hypothetical protein
VLAAECKALVTQLARLVVPAVVKRVVSEPHEHVRDAPGVAECSVQIEALVVVAEAELVFAGGSQRASERAQPAHPQCRLRDTLHQFAETGLSFERAARDPELLERNGKSQAERRIRNACPVQRRSELRLLLEHELVPLALGCLGREVR